LSDPSYLDRYGFIPDINATDKHQLPVGFAHGGLMRDASGAPWQNPQTKGDMTAVGLTCAAYHTGRFTFQNTTVLIDGGPALTDLDKLRTGTGLGDAKTALRNQLDQVLAQVAAIRKLDEMVKHQSVEEGYARLDALNRIGNSVFALDLNDFDNYVGTSAPVHFPRIWNASWFDWVQYNGSIEQPMVRNAGEALGVLAAVNLVGSKDERFTSSVQVNTLFELEKLIAGTPPDPATASMA
jgi:hypothetical protein